MIKKGHFSEFECGLVVDARGTGLIIRTLLSYKDFHTDHGLKEGK